jgi:H+/Cl- antiporter ClcA
MLSAIVYLVLVCALAALALWAIRELGTPDPVARVARVVVIGLALLIIIGIVAGLFGVNTGLPHLQP